MLKDHILRLQTKKIEDPYTTLLNSDEKLLPQAKFFGKNKCLYAKITDMRENLEFGEFLLWYFPV
jgi:hypothetical protein